MEYDFEWQRLMGRAYDGERKGGTNVVVRPGGYHNAFLRVRRRKGGILRKNTQLSNPAASFPHSAIRILVQPRAKLSPSGYPASSDIKSSRSAMKE
jgi:hypothetical protein